MALKIRIPDAHDRLPLLEMAKAMHAESPRYKGRDFSEQKAQGIIDYFIEQQGAFVVEDDGVIFGMIAGIVCEQFFGFDKYVSDLVVYIKPEKRGGSGAVRLIRAFEDWAFAMGAAEVLLGVSTGVEMERTVALYQRLGYTITSTSLIKEKKNV